MKELLVLSLAVFGWRGDWTGQYPGAEPATSWSSQQAIVWKTPMPDWSNASPILWNDRIFCCAEPSTLLCLNEADGKILWQQPNQYLDLLEPSQRQAAEQEARQLDQLLAKLTPVQRELGRAKNQLKKLQKAQSQPASTATSQIAASQSQPVDQVSKLEQKIKDLQAQVDAVEEQIKPLERLRVPKTHKTNGYSSPTPLTDGKHVWAVFGNGVACCYTIDGQRVWARMIEKPQNPQGWGHSASPALVDGKLIVHIVDLHGLDPLTGRTIWSTKAPVKYGTPLPMTLGNTAVVVTPGGDVVRARDGQILASRIAEAEYCTPINNGPIVYFFNDAQKDKTACAVELTLEDDKVQAKTLWQAAVPKERYYASQILHNGLLYALTRYNEFSVVEADTGKIVYTRKLELGKGSDYPSITLAGSYLFVSSENGTTFVLTPGREYKEIARNQLEPFRSTPIFRGQRMYVRALKNFYCIGG